MTLRLIIFKRQRSFGYYIQTVGREVIIFKLLLIAGCLLYSNFSSSTYYIYTLSLSSNKNKHL